MISPFVVSCFDRSGREAKAPKRWACRLAPPATPTHDGRNRADASGV